ncbi:MAG: ABC transporter ATP-binding protein [Candidatus Rokubacteria bacterium]|nr:ABC transporter ATP-binding protein [Candidatus Rokubacteria bacterium]MBI3105394.1 ABC transporter ATP-binding protein [Candidatus Rokubacteria bacterium]
MPHAEDLATPAIECDGVTRRFGGLEAVSQVSLRLAAGERRAIIGPNGAGKTTLFRMISGEMPLTAGRVRLFGRDITTMPCHRRTHLGLGRTFQITNLFPTLSVLDNLILAALGLERTKFSMLRPLWTYREPRARALEVLETVGLADKRDGIVRTLSHGEQRQIEMALALLAHPRVLLLDEPTAGLSPAESALMTRAIQKLDRGISILLIEHDMDVVFDIVDRITVLHLGRFFAEGSPAEVRTDPRVQEIYFGAGEIMAC